MKIEIPIPDGAELIERDAYARGMLEGMKMRAVTYWIAGAVGFVAGFGVAATLFSR